MQKQDIIILIINCEKYRYKAEIQRKGWLQTIPPEIIYFHVIGNEKLKSDFIFDHENRILYVKTKDDYNSLSHKVISAFEAVHKTYEYIHIFKIDDDQTLAEPHFFNLLLDYLKTSITHYGGQIAHVKEDELSLQYLFHPEVPNNIILKKGKYCGGRFYILSNISVADLLPKKEFIIKEYFEDYAIGYYLSQELKQNILPIPSYIFKTIT